MALQGAGSHQGPFHWADNFEENDKICGIRIGKVLWSHGNEFTAKVIIDMLKSINPSILSDGTTKNTKRPGVN